MTFLGIFNLLKYQGKFARSITIDADTDGVWACVMVRSTTKGSRKTDCRT